MLLRASRIYRAVCAAIYLGAGSTVLVLPVSLLAQIALGFLIVTSALLTLRPQQQSLIGLELIEPNLVRARFTSATGVVATCESELGVGSVILPGMVKLGLCQPLAATGESSVLVWYDQAGKDDFRRLRRELARWMHRSRNSGVITQS